MFSGAREVYSAAEIDHAVDRMAVRITVAMQDMNPVLIAVMHGGLVCAGMLMRRLAFPLQQGYVHVGRYGDATRGGELSWRAQDCPPLEGRHVLLADDILDQGQTLAELLRWTREQGAASVRACVLVDKQIAETSARPEVDFVALEAPDEFLVGCGMDFKGYGRNLPGLYALQED